MDKVSVIIPVYNTPKEYLEECIDSILNQTYKNIEIIIIDDGSNEDIALHCDIIAKRDERIKIIHKKNEGVSVARNIGIENAEGKWICFCDSDDIFVKNAIESLTSISTNSEVIISRIEKEELNQILGYSDSIIKLNEQEKKELIYSIFMDKGNKFAYVDSVCSKLYLKNFIDNNNIRFEKGLAYGEDGLFNFNCYYIADSISYTSEVLYKYRKNTSSVTHLYTRKLITSHDELFKKYDNALNKIKDKEIYKAYYFYTVRQIDKFCMRFIFHDKNNMNFKNEIAELKEISCREPYQTAIKQIDTDNLFLKRKLLVYMLRFKQYWLIAIMYKLNNVKNKIISFFKQ